MKTNLFKVLRFLGVLLPVLSTSSFGQQTERMEQIKQILDGLKWTTGSVVLGNGIANLNGLAALILGGVAVKAGLLKGLLAVLAAGWKVIAVAVVAIGGFFTRFFRRITKSRAVVRDASIQNKTTPDT
jgi:hypothetical protein